MKNKKKKKLNAGSILILLGILMIVAGLLYEAANYPWRVVLERFGVSYEELLPDPPDISAVWATEPKTTTGSAEDPAETGEPSSEGQESTNSVLPGEGGGGKAALPTDMVLLGYIKIPRLGISYNILEGMDAELKYGVGHMEGSGALGGAGNCVLAGHRNRITMHPFRHLDLLEAGDRVHIEDQETRYIYEVYESFVVEPEEVWVLSPVEGEAGVLTLITCTPVLSSSHRLIVRGRLLEAVPLA